MYLLGCLLLYIDNNHFNINKKLMKKIPSRTYESVEIKTEFIKIEEGFAQTGTESGTTGQGFSDGGTF